MRNTFNFLHNNVSNALLYHDNVVKIQSKNHSKKNIETVRKEQTTYASISQLNERLNNGTI